MSSLLPLETLGASIKARIAAGDKSIDKAEDHYRAAGIELLEAKERIKHTNGITWPAFLIGHCSIGRSRADELIDLANGKTTLARLREGTNERKKKHRNLPFRNGKSSEKLQLSQHRDPESKQLLEGIAGTLLKLSIENLRLVSRYLKENFA